MRFKLLLLALALSSLALGQQAPVGAVALDGSDSTAASTATCTPPLACAAGSPQVFSISATPSFTSVTASGLTSSGVVLAGTGGLLGTDAGLTYSASALRISQTLGPELVTNGSFTGGTTGWTLNTGWAYGTNSVAHSAGNTGVLEQTTVVPVQYAIYQATIVVSAISAGSTIYVQVGGNTGSLISTAGTYTYWIRAYDTTDLKIVPVTATVATVTSVSVKLVTSTHSIVIDPAPANVGTGAAIYANNPGGVALVTASSDKPQYLISDYTVGAGGERNISALFDSAGAFTTHRSITSVGNAGGTYDPATGVVSVNAGSLPDMPHYMIGAGPDAAGPGFGVETDYSGGGGYGFQLIEKDVSTSNVPKFVMSIHGDGALGFGYGANQLAEDAGWARRQAGWMTATNGWAGAGGVNAGSATVPAFRTYNLGAPGDTDYEWGGMYWDGNYFYLSTNKGGSGAGRSLALSVPFGARVSLGTTAGDVVRVDQTHFFPPAQNAVDLGDDYYTFRTVYADTAILGSRTTAFTSNTATTVNIADIAVRSNSSTSGEVQFEVELSDGTDFSVIRGRFAYAATNKAGTLAVSAAPAVFGSSNAASAGAGAIGATATVTTGTNLIHLNVVPTWTVYAPTVKNINWRIDSTQTNAITAIP